MEFVSVDVVQGHADRKPFVLMPIGDIQWAGKGGSTTLDLLKRRIETGLELGAMFLGMGDMIDLMSPSNRAEFSRAGLYDTTRQIMDAKASDLVQELFDLALRPTVGKWIGLLEGHHFTEMLDGSTSDMLLCRLLKTRHLGSSCFGRIRFAYGKVKQGDVTFWAHHGQGGGMRVSGPINKLETLANSWEADIFLMGHATKMPSAPINRVYASWAGGVPHLRHRKIILVGTGGFSRGYIEGNKIGQVPRGCYVEKGMMSPTHLGCPIVRIWPRTVEEHYGPKVKRHGVRVWSPEITVEL